MPYDRFMISNISTGQQTNVKPWLILDDGFERLQNCVVFRDRIIKRFGTVWMGPGNDQKLTRLRINIGVTSGPINLPGDATQLKIGQTFSVGSDIFTVYQLGAGVLTLSTNPGATATIDSTSNPNTVTFTGEPAATDVYYYPSNPVMGLTQYEIGEINNHPAYAFDTQFAYVYTSFASGWQLSTGSPTFHGDYQDFFWAANYRGLTEDETVLFVTNFNASTGAGRPVATDDPIYAYSTGNGWSIFRPVFNSDGAFVQTSRLITVFKNTLILLNTIENDNSTGPGNGIATQYKTRARWCHPFQSPFRADVPETPSNAWLQGTQTRMGLTANGAGFVDAPTEEEIISCEFIKDRLIVYFERSCWELVYTGNYANPFIWQKINTELGSQSTFSIVPFDNQVLAIGNTGVHSCNGINVERIDNKIPDSIFDFVVKNNATVQTCGIRDYQQEMVYWSYIITGGPPTQIFPNQLMVYNYRNNSWSFFDDTFTAFGYFEQQNDETWSSSTDNWQSANYSWISNVVISQQRQILAGNQEGYVFVIRPSEPRNAPSLQITNMTTTATLTVINHNLKEGDYVLIENASGITSFNDTICRVESVIDANTIILAVDAPGTGTYAGGGTLSRVSQINILSKQYNPYDKQSRNIYIAKIDFLVNRTDTGQITVDYYPSSTNLSMIQAGEATNSISGTNVLETFPYTLYPLEQQQVRLWHTIYCQSDGECIQLNIYFNDLQMKNPDISLVDFQLHGFILWATPTSDRLQ